MQIFASAERCRQHVMSEFASVGKDQMADILLYNLDAGASSSVLIFFLVLENLICRDFGIINCYYDYRGTD